MKKIENKDDFVEWVWQYGASGYGCKSFDELNENQQYAIAMAWSEACRLMNKLPKDDDCTEIDELIGTYYNDFIEGGNKCM